MSNTNEPPPPNPILSAYETFKNETPLVTRYTMTTITVSFIASFFVDPSFALNCIPYFTIIRFELYRILTAPLVCQNVLSLIFAYISFVDHAKRLEYSMGSCAFLWLMMTLCFTTNIIFLAICFLLCGLSGGEQAYLYMQSTSIWIILFGLISIDAAKAPAGSKRRLFFCDVPTLYYPLGLLGIFSLLGGFSLAFCISTGVGYAYGNGYLDFTKLSDARFKSWEDGVLQNFTRRQGWIAGHAASGSDAWSNSGGSTGFSMFQPRGRGNNGSGSSSNTGSVGLATPRLPAPGPASPPADVATGGFPKSGGRKLGSATRRASSSAEKRSAMLEAAAKRASAPSDENV